MDLASATASLREKVGTQSGLNTTLGFAFGRCKVSSGLSAALRLQWVL